MTRAPILLFPQWQGSGSPQAPLLREGAERIATLVGLQHLRVPSAPGLLETEAGIRGRAQLLTQLALARALLETERAERLFTIGGDCGVDLAPASYLNARHRDLALVWLDAHGDLNTPGTSPSGAFHGMVLRTLLGEGDADFLGRAFSLFAPEQVFLAGARDFDPAERAYAGGLEYLAVSTLERQRAALAGRIKARGFTKLHVHLDLDVLEPTEFASTGYPTPNGLSLEGLLGLLNALCTQFDVVGVTLTEFTPKVRSDLRVIKRIVETVLKLYPASNAVN